MNENHGQINLKIQYFGSDVVASLCLIGTSVIKQNSVYLHPGVNTHSSGIWLFGYLVRFRRVTHTRYSGEVLITGSRLECRKNHRSHIVVFLCTARVNSAAGYRHLGAPL